MAESPGLAGVQRWMVGLLHGEDHESPANARYQVDGVLAPSPTMTAAECLHVYRRGYRLRLLECLREMHPALLHLAGDELFEAFATDYLDAHPPAGYSLFQLGDGLAEHLQATRPDRDLPEQDREPWADLVVEVVRFERAFLEVYDGPGVEGVAVASSADVADVADVAAGGPVWVTGVPCLRVVRGRFPVGAYVRAVRRGEKPPMPAPAPAYEALLRRNYVVDALALDATSCAVLEALLDGAGTAEAARAGGTTEAVVLGWVAAWADRGLFSQIAAAPQPDPSISPREAPCC